MANESDSRSWSGFTEDVRVSALPHPLNPAIFTSAACGGTCNANARLGRLTVTSALGLNPITNQYDALYTFGGRSFSIWDENGNQVWDSGAQFETADDCPVVGELQRRRGRERPRQPERQQGAELEGVAVGPLGAKTFAFIGLERVGVFEIVLQ